VGVTTIVRAAGGVLWRNASPTVEILLVHRPAYDDWSFPKGKLKPKERDEEAALREVEEETGLRCRLERELGGVTYRDRKGRPKIVRYWLMRPLSGDFAPTDEVDQVRWLPFDEALGALSYEHDRALLRRILEPSARGPVRPAPRDEASATSPLYLVRHAKAGVREEWAARDEIRPLTEEGFLQAQLLVDDLDGLPIDSIISSPYVRCRQTVEPLARARGLSIEDEARLAEGTPASAVWELLGALGDRAGALCTHGDIIELVLDRLVREGTIAEQDVVLKKGSTWVLDARDGRIVRAHYLPPPSA
jgi:8-oxo-(d)GTP phosphatase